MLMALLLTLPFLGEARVSIHLQPAAILSGSNVRIWCRVPKHEDNRFLLLELVDVSSSTRQLDGAEAPSVHDLLVENVPCLGTVDPESGHMQMVAGCLLKDNRGKIYEATQILTVAGCSR
jgi:hypothetical protein